MKKRKFYSILAISLSAFALLGWGCSENEFADSRALSKGLILNLSVDGQPAASATSDNLASNALLREDVVETVDVFFVQDGAVKKYVQSTVTNGKATLGNDPLTGVFDIYVLANRHQTTDLTQIKTLDDLLLLKDTDIDIARAEGEKTGTNNSYKDKTFLMDGKVTDWDADTQTTGTSIAVDLSRAAAKFVVNVQYNEGFLSPESGRTVVGVSKKLIHYTSDVRAFADGSSIALVELPVQGNSSIDDFSEANTTAGSGTARTDVLYAYSYPNEWGNDVAERETYFLVNVRYTDNTHSEPINNYYKVPVRVSSKTEDLKLNRNTQYTVNVTIDRLGNESIDEAENLTPMFTIESWQPETINVDSDTPNYLMLSEYNIEMRNVADTTVTFFSSTPIKVEVTDAFYVNKYGDEVRSKEDGSTVKGLIKTVYDTENLQGDIRINSPIPDNVTARYITLTVTNTNQPVPISKEVTIVQYPLEYISGVPGWYSARSDFDATWLDAGKNFSSQPKVSEGGLIGGLFSSRVYDESWGILPYGTNAGGGILGTINYDPDGEGQDNNRMYVVQITSTTDKYEESQYCIARPTLTADNDGELITASDDENTLLVSPTFMLASQLGITGGSNWDYEKAIKHCKNYIEVAKFSNGDTMIFDDWRMPTYAEFSIIASYQNDIKVKEDEVIEDEVIEKVLVFPEYITAATSTKYKYYKVPGNSGMGTGVRCIRDVTPQDLETLHAHGVK